MAPEWWSQSRKFGHAHTFFLLEIKNLLILISDADRIRRAQKYFLILLTTSMPQLPAHDETNQQWLMPKLYKLPFENK